MKRWVLLCIVILLSVVAVLLSAPAQEPGDFTGHWYSIQNRTLYLFQEGMIYSPTGTLYLDGQEGICGGYCFSGKSMALFAMDVEGLEEVTELYLVKKAGDSYLCDRPDGTGEVYFVRQK